MRKLFPVCLLLLALAAAPTQPATRNFARWENEIAAIEQRDRHSPPPKGGVLFIGSSTIKRWESLSDDFAGHTVINQGFGGSQIVDATHFADRLIVPHEPKMILLRAGGNDIHAGKSAEQVFDDYRDFVTKVFSNLPDTTIVFIGLCPAPLRWEEREANKRLNALVEQFSRRTPGLKYIETYDMSLTSDGQAREELFVADRLHFNAEGYKLLAQRVRPFLPPRQGSK